jgi:hypothetical protein
MLRLSVPRRVVVLAFTASAGAGIAVGTLGACSAGGAQAPGTVPAAATAPVSSPITSPTPSPSTVATPAPAASGPVTADQASAIAVQASPGTVTEVEQDGEPAGPVFDVKVQHPDGTETKVEVDAATGQVLSTETEGQGVQNGQDDHDQSGAEQ